MGNYVKILEEVEAVRATEDNLEEIKKLAGDVKKVKSFTNKPSYYWIYGIVDELCVGDWIIKHKSGRLEVKSNRNFLMEYEPK